MPRYPALARHKIPYEPQNTDHLVKQLIRIAETRPFLDDDLGSPLEVKLLRKAKVRAITYSNQIEGNALEEVEVTALLKGKRVAGPAKDILEIQNYHSALDYVDQLIEDPRPLQLSDMCDLQRLVTAGTLPEKQSGRIRTVSVSIVNAATHEKIEDCPEPHALRELLDDLWKWLEDTKAMNPLIRAFAFHFIAVSIHPFTDGNGRTVRLMQHLLLLQDGERLARFVPSETTIMRNRDRYYAVIKRSRTLGKLDPVIEFLAECFATSAEEVVEEAKRLLRESAGKTPHARHLKILAHARKKEKFSMQDVAEWLPDIPRRTLERDLATLVRKRSLKAAGQLKARTYSLAKWK